MEQCGFLWSSTFCGAFDIRVAVAIICCSLLLPFTLLTLVLCVCIIGLVLRFDGVIRRNNYMEFLKDFRVYIPSLTFVKSCENNNGD